MKCILESGVFDCWDYYPFGMLNVGRNWSAGTEYRYGFNGKEQDDETNGNGNVYDYGFRVYNPRLGKFLSIDPLTKSYPFYSSYQFAGNAPIWAIDLDGLEQAVVIRWYDGQGNWTGSEVFSIQNSNDRPLGSNNFLYINLQNTAANHAAINSLWQSTSNPNPVNSTNSNSLTNFLSDNQQGSTTGNLTDFSGNPISLQDPQGNLTLGVAFTRGQLSIEDNTLLTRVTGNIQSGQISEQLVIPNSDVIYFPFASSQYNANLDPDGNGINNGQEINQAINKLNQNPDRVAIVTGNSSNPDQTGTNNVPLSNQRATAVTNILNQANGNANQVVNAGGMSNTNATGNNNIDQNATITYNIPIQSQ